MNVINTYLTTSYLQELGNHLSVPVARLSLPQLLSRHNQIVLRQLTCDKVLANDLPCLPFSTI